MSKLIVIGCAHVLATDSKWLKYIELCEEQKSYCGAPLVRRTQGTIDLINKRFQNIQLGTQKE